MVDFWMGVMLFLLAATVVMFIWWLVKKLRHKNTKIEWWHIVLVLLAFFISISIVATAIENSPKHIQEQLKITNIKKEYDYDGENLVHVTGYTKPGAKVKLFALGQKIKTKTADDSGKFSFKLAALDYEIEASEDGQKEIKRFSITDTSEDDDVDTENIDIEDEDVDSLDTDNEDEDSSSESKAFNSTDYQTGITYDQLARTPDDFDFKKVTFNGTVGQVQNDDDVTTILLYINGDSDQTAMVDIETSDLNGSRILEDDNVTVYGKSANTTDYESVMGEQITVPYILADKIQY